MVGISNIGDRNGSTEYRCGGEQFHCRTAANGVDATGFSQGIVDSTAVPRSSQAHGQRAVHGANGAVLGTRLAAATERQDRLVVDAAVGEPNDWADWQKRTGEYGNGLASRDREQHLVSVRRLAIDVGESGKRHGAHGYRAVASVRGSINSKERFHV